VTLAARLAGLGALLSMGCAAALKEPPPVSALQRGAVGSTPADALLQEAAEEYAKRPDAAAVRRAEGLCLHAAQTDEAGTAGLICAIQAKAWLAEREKDVKVRTDLAVSAVQVGQWCVRRDAKSAPCKFWLAVALGMQARDRPTTVEDGLKRMAQLLREAAKDSPLLEEAGPERVLSLLLARAPGWPVGPGDVEEALVLARSAVGRRPDYPPNQVALAEVLLKNDRKPAAQEAIAKAIALARTAPYASDPDAPSWIAEAEALRAR
jgi:hypothetical protein